MTERVSFKTDGGSTLVGTLTLPSGKDKAKVVLLLHGWHSSRQTGRNGLLAEKLATEGIGSLAFDFRGHGESEGDIRQVTVLTEAEDVLSAYAYLGTVKGLDLAPGLGIVGASIGGSAALYSLSINPSAFKCGVLIAPRLDFSEVAEDEYCFDGPDGRVENRSMLLVGRELDFYKYASRITCPVMVIHGTNDEFISIEQPRKLVRMYPKMELIEIEEGDHRLQTHGKQIVRDVVGFLTDYLG